MADLNDLQSAQSIKISGADTSGVETNYVKVSNNQDLGTSDVADTSAVYGALSVTTTASEVKVGVNPLSNRKLISIQARNSGVYLGYSNSVTTSNGTELSANDILLIPVGPNVRIWLIANTGTKDVRIAELS